MGLYLNVPLACALSYYPRILLFLKSWVNYSRLRLQLVCIDLLFD